MSSRSFSHVEVSMVLTRADNLCIHNYIRSLLNITYLLAYFSRTHVRPDFEIFFQASLIIITFLISSISF